MTRSLLATDEELAEVVKKIRSRKTTPGADGVPGRVMMMIVNVLCDILKNLFSACLKKGMFTSI